MSEEAFPEDATVVVCSGDGCEQRLIANSPDSEGYCPDCAGEWRSSADHDRQAAAHREQRNRQRVVDNASGQGGSL